jgi:hypothetical protein
MVKGWRTATIATMATAAVLCGGAASATTTHHASAGHFTMRAYHGRNHHSDSAPGVFGTVASVNGSDMTGACGTSGDTFTLTARKNTTTIWTVTVNGSTTYADPAVSGTPTFANVCVGDVVGVAGTVSSATDTVNPATKVSIAPVGTTHQPHGGYRSHGDYGSDGSFGRYGGFRQAH